MTDALRDSFAESRYFDVFIEYAKAGQEDILCRISAVNRGPEAAPIHILPHVWFRNTWSWGYDRRRPELRALDDGSVYTDHRHLGERWWYAAPGSAGTGPDVNLLFTENETNQERLYGAPNPSPYVKDGINDAVVDGQADRVNPERRGTKAAAHFQQVVPPGETFTVWVRFADTRQAQPFADFEAVFEQRIREADEFYAADSARGDHPG